MRWRSAVVGLEGFGAIVSVAAILSCGDADWRGVAVAVADGCA